MVVIIAAGRAPSPASLRRSGSAAAPRFAGEGAGSAGHPSPAERGRVAERSEAGWGRDRPAKAQSLKA